MHAVDPMLWGNTDAWSATLDTLQRTALSAKMRSLEIHACTCVRKYVAETGTWLHTPHSIQSTALTAKWILSEVTVWTYFGKYVRQQNYSMTHKPVHLHNMPASTRIPPLIHSDRMQSISGRLHILYHLQDGWTYIHGGNHLASRLSYAPRSWCTGPNSSA